MHRLLARLLVLAIAVYTAQAAISCYQCTSEADAECSKQTPPEKFLLPCPESSTHCGKSNRTIDEGPVITNRTCEIGTDLEIKMNGCVIRKVVDFTAVCNTDGCNGALI